jgi:ABC-type branched-subunit amino acid transport system substrate-binding protein
MTSKIRIGLFLQRASTALPQASANFVDGLAAGLDDRNFEILTYEVNPGARAFSSAYARACTMDSIDIALANLAYSALQAVQNALILYNKPLFITTSGADITRRDELHPLIFRNSLQYWQSAYEAGKWARETYGKVLLVTTMFDCGFDSHAAFLIGAQIGAEPTPFVIADAPDYDFHADAILKKIAETKPDALAVFAQGSLAVKILSTLAADPTASKLPAIHGPMLHEIPLRNSIGAALEGKTSFFSFADERFDTPASESFVKAWQKRSSRMPDIFAVAGYESSLFIRAAFENTRDPVGAAKALESAKIESPRGTVCMDSTLHTTTSPIYRRLMKECNGRRVQTIASEFDSMHGDSAAANAVSDGHMNRWNVDYMQF